MNTPSFGKTQAFLKIYFSGVGGWLIGTVLLFSASWLLTKPETFSTALMWALSYWWVAFLLGFATLLGRASLAKEGAGPAALAYLLPALVLAVASGLCLAVYPDARLREDILGFLPIVLVFYVFGFVWAQVRRESSHPFARVVIPPITGGLLILAFIAVPIFTSPAFIYRNAFGLTVVKATKQDGALTAETILEIRKPGRYQFTSPEFGIGDWGGEPDSGANKVKVEMTWGAAGQPKDDAIGSFPLKIRWPKFVVPMEMLAAPEFMAPAILEVRDPNRPDTVIYTVSAPLPLEGK